MLSRNVKKLFASHSRAILLQKKKNQVIDFNAIYNCLYIHQLTHIVKYIPAKQQYQTQYHDVTLP